MGGFFSAFNGAGSQWLASAGSLKYKQWKWLRGDCLESAPANQPTHEELRAESEEPKQRLKSS
jgi:hypothetical protein